MVPWCVRYGYNLDGVHKDGHRQSEGASVGTDQYDKDGFNWQGMISINKIHVFNKIATHRMN